MFSQFKPFSLMGISNSEMLLPQKDLYFLVRPALEFQDECDIISPLQEHHISEQGHEQEQEKEQEQEDKCKLLVSTLKIKLPSLGEFISDQEDQEDIENNDGCKTPTSLDHKIPVIFPCPPPPRKPKSLPSNKRKSPSAAAHRRVLLDLSNEIESLFPPALRADLGRKIKKVRHENEIKLGIN